MEDIVMKISRININKLYGYIDYSINFNNDVTFLYGDNGCGKTTILNILTYIITGKVYELYNYEFKSISMQYCSSTDDKLKEVSVSYSDPDREKICVNFNDRSSVIDVQKIRIMEHRTNDIDEYERFFFSENEILNEIRNEFNYVYLPLNRNGSMCNDYSYPYRNRKMIQSRMLSHRSLAFNDITLIDVETLVKDAYNKVNFILNKLSERFTQDVLKSFLDVQNISSIPQILTYLNNLNENEIKRIQTKYSEVLKNMEKWDDSTEEKVDTFFKSLLNDIEKARNDKNELEAEILFKLSELNKINNIIYKADKIEKKKELVKLPIENFISTVNCFIGSGNAKKEAKMDTDGSVYLKTPYIKRIDLHHLSSGEKQIITFFAYLVFGLQDTKQSIFIVDEPELSLHLKWQKQFVDAIIGINPSVQLIFATHSPEIIGRHRDKAVKLIPKI